MVMASLPGTNPYIRTDKNGRTCRSNIMIPVCKGHCLSKEYGTHKFPFRHQNSNICIQEGGYLDTVPMDECDEGADESIRTYKILRNSTCVCKK
uniref:Cys_knot domain-containing protein n=1 Tax=Syphacia muris TaxID=451379 RepID=A0A0N5AQD3_9BILA